MSRSERKRKGRYLVREETSIYTLVPSKKAEERVPDVSLRVYWAGEGPEMVDRTDGRMLTSFDMCKQPKEVRAR